MIERIPEGKSRIVRAEFEIAAGMVTLTAVGALIDVDWIAVAGVCGGAVCTLKFAQTLNTFWVRDKVSRPENDTGFEDR